MPKLHELLAVRDNVRGQSEKVRTGLTDTFNKKRHLFEKKVTTFTPNTEGAPTRTEQQSELQSTVRKELSWVKPIIAKALNVETTVDVGNTFANADVLLEDGTKLLLAVPATALLSLAKRLGEVKQLVESIPTLDPARSFQPASDEGEGVYAAREVTKNRTSKETIPLVLYEATDKHPAQVQLVQKDVVTGVIKELEWSGLITPADKAAMLERVERLIRACTSALSRANDAEVDNKMSVGETLLTYVFGV